MVEAPRRPLLKGCLVAAAFPIAIALVLLGPVDWWKRYSSWRNLTKADLAAEAQNYVDEYALGNSACLYAVVCKDGKAGLDRIEAIEDWDIDAAKRLAWNRRFSGNCPGRTANFAVRIAADDPLDEITNDRVRYGVWSFSNDRFVPSWGRFAPFRAFSELPTESCISQYSVTRSPGRRQVAPTDS
ncbi:hypothetical protein [Citromicrobium bathyomarinum]|uniref:hypothetical protein n=1 Tax=Citromicrobium bathyomarinum TaxID=72174 RepID=UPI00315998AE